MHINKLLNVLLVHWVLRLRWVQIWHFNHLVIQLVLESLLNIWKKHIFDLVEKEILTILHVFDNQKVFQKVIFLKIVSFHDILQVLFKVYQLFLVTVNRL